MLKKLKPVDRLLKYSLISLLIVVPPNLFHDSFVIPKIILFTVVVICALALNKKNNNRSLRILIALGIFPLTTLFVSIQDNYNFFTNFFGDYRRGFGIYLTTLVTLFVIILGSSPKIDIIKFLKYLFNAALIIVIYQFLQIIGSDFLNISNAGTYSSLIGNINMASSIVAAFILSSLSLNQIYNIKYKYFIIPFVLILFFSLSKFNSSQAYLVLLVGFFTFFYYLYVGKLTNIKILHTVIYGLVWFIGTLFLYRIIKFEPLFSLLNQDGNYARRIEYWDKGLDIFFKYPISGVGLNGFLDEYNKIRSKEAVRFDGAAAWIDSPHSVPIQMLSSGGIVLFLGWLIFIITISYFAVKNFQTLPPSSPERRIQLTIASIWFGFSSQFLVSIWETTAIISTSILAAVILNQSNTNLGTSSVKSIKTIFYYVRKINIYLLNVFLILSIIFLLVTQIFFANYNNRENPTTSTIIKLLKFYPNYFLIDFLAYSDLTKNRIESAIELEKISIGLNPNNSKAFYNLGISYRALNRLDDSIKMFSNALRLDPNNVLILEQFINAQLEIGNKLEAKKLYQTLIEIDPKFKGAFDSNLLN